MSGEDFEAAVRDTLRSAAAVDPATFERVRDTISTLPEPRQGLLARRGLRGGRFVFAALLGSLAIVAIVGVSLRPHQGPAASPSPVASAATSTPLAVAVTPSPTPSPTPTPAPSWPTTSAGIIDAQRIDERSGCLAVQRDDRHLDSVLLMTDDAGATWRDITPPDLRVRFVVFEFADRDHGWVMPADEGGAQRRLWRTSDGGRSWATTKLPPGIADLVAMSYVTPAVGYLLLPTGGAAAPYTLFVTRDGGATFESLGSPGPGVWPDRPDRGFRERAMRFLTVDDGVIVGRPGLQTHDGGRHWSPITRADFTGLPVEVTRLLAGGASFIVSGPAFSALSLEGSAMSDDYGRTWHAAAQIAGWETVVSGTGRLLRFSAEGVATPGGTVELVERSDDAGVTWVRLPPGLPPISHPIAVSFSSADVGWAVMHRDCVGTHCQDFPMPSGDVLAETRDGGASWSPVEVPRR